MHELVKICGEKETFPRSFRIKPDSLAVQEYPFAAGSFGDTYKGTLCGKAVCVKRLKLFQGTGTEIKKVRYWHFLLHMHHLEWIPQNFRRDAVIWKYLKHPNVLPFLGATIDPPQLISVLMADNLSEYLIKNPKLCDPDRLGLVGVPLVVMIQCLLWSPVARYCEGPRLHPLSPPASWKPQASTLLS